MEKVHHNLENEIRVWQKKLFSLSVYRARKQKLVSELLGHISDAHCLEITVGDGEASRALRDLGGSWKSVALSIDAAFSSAIAIGEPISLIEKETLPFEDQHFDLVVIFDGLSQIEDDQHFIRECHRVLKDSGWVLISETCRRPLAFSSFLRRFFGTLPTARGAKRDGYALKELYTILKDGFDVPEAISWSNGLFETASAVGEQIQKSMGILPYWLVRPAIKESDLYLYRKLHTLGFIFRPLLRFFALFEILPGHHLFLKSRRRPWRPRTQLKLQDGRSVAEVIASTKVGTAAPF
jgi:ubiquinone/menaquinone biosynthesis C-methylase UbiE